jgi:glycosyltransferase involved in cell wall biosynthesis
MALGIPTVCLKWGGPELLVTDECGILITPVNEDHVVTELAAAMDKLAVHPEIAERMSIAGREMAQSYTWSHVASQWVGIYEELLDGPSDIVVKVRTA